MTDHDDYEEHDERYDEWDGPSCCYYHADGGHAALPCGSDSVGERVNPGLPECCPYHKSGGLMSLCGDDTGQGIVYKISPLWWR